MTNEDRVKPRNSGDCVMIAKKLRVECVSMRDSALPREEIFTRNVGNDTATFTPTEETSRAVAIDVCVQLRREDVWVSESAAVS